MVKGYFTALSESGVVLDMHRLGLIMGLSPESSVEYYRLINEGVRAELNGKNSPIMLMENVNFAFTEAMMGIDAWICVEQQIGDAAMRLTGAGAEAIAICSNTIHRVVDNIKNIINKPIIHIGDCVAEKIANLGLERVGLLGTSTTMQGNFMKERLLRSGVTILTPDIEKHDRIDRIIFDELCHGEIREESRAYLKQVILGMVEECQMQAVILGCTELPLIIDSTVQDEFRCGNELVYLDSTAIHVAALVDFCCYGRLPKTVAE